MNVSLCPILGYLLVAAFFSNDIDAFLPLFFLSCEHGSKQSNFIASCYCYHSACNSKKHGYLHAEELFLKFVIVNIFKACSFNALVDIY